MELILKIPKGKPPFIGVLFNFQVDACITNKSWLDGLQGQSNLILDPAEKLYITMSKTPHFSDRYAVNYNAIELLKFLHFTKDSKEFLFGHLLMKGDSYQIATVNVHNSIRKFLFKIDKIKIKGLCIELNNYS